MPSVAPRERKPFTTTDDEVFDPIECLRIHEKVMGPHMVHHGGTRFAQEMQVLAFPMRPLPAETRLLNIGCGFGGVACRIARSCPEVTVVVCDPNEELIDEVRRRVERSYPDLEGRVTIYSTDLDKISFPPGTFDAIIAIELNAMQCSDRDELVGKKFKEWLKPAGRLVMADYCWSRQVQSLITAVPEGSTPMAAPGWDDINYRSCLRDSYPQVTIRDDTLDQLSRVTYDLLRLQKQQPNSKREESLIRETMDQWKNLKHMLAHGSLTWRMMQAETPGTTA